MKTHPLDTAPFARPPPPVSHRGLGGAEAALGALLALLAVNAIGGGVYGLGGAPGVPVTWLAGSPFDSYWLPSVVLLVVVGGAAAGGAIAVLGRWRTARKAAVAAGVVALLWIAVQSAVIGWVSWLQPAVAMAGALILALSRAVPDRRR